MIAASVVFLGPLVLLALVALAVPAALVGGFVLFYRSRRSPLTRALLVIVPVLVLEGLLPVHGIWSTLVLLVGFAAQLLLTTAAFIQGRRGLCGRRLGATVLYAASIVGVVAWLGGSNHAAQERTERLILASHRYPADSEESPTTHQRGEDLSGPDQGAEAPHQAGFRRGSLAGAASGPGLLPGGVDEGAVLHGSIPGHKNHPMGTGGGSNQSVSGVPREVWRKPKRQGRDLWSDGKDAQARALAE